jgi:hypothetical protein
MKFDPETFTHALCTFGIFGMPGCLKSMYSALKKGGYVGVTTWRSLMWYVSSAPFSYTHLHMYTVGIC